MGNNIFYYKQTSNGKSNRQKKRGRDYLSQTRSQTRNQTCGESHRQTRGGQAHSHHLGGEYYPRAQTCRQACGHLQTCHRQGTSSTQTSRATNQIKTWPTSERTYQERCDRSEKSSFLNELIYTFYNNMFIKHILITSNISVKI